MAFADPLDAYVASRVAEQITAFELNGVSVDRAWKMMTGRDAMAGSITWDHVANRVEDNYREMNLLKPRKKNEFDHYYLRKITYPPPPERIGHEIR